MTNKLYVGNISETTTDSDLLELFSKTCSVISAKVSVGIDKTKNAGYGYVVINDEKDMKKAVLKYNNSMLKGNRIKVTAAHYIDRNENYLVRQNRFRGNRR